MTQVVKIVRKAVAPVESMEEKKKKLAAIQKQMAAESDEEVLDDDEEAVDEDAATSKKARKPRKPNKDIELDGDEPAGGRSAPWIKAVKAWAGKKGYNCDIDVKGARLDITPAKENEGWRMVILHYVIHRFDIAIYFDFLSAEYPKSVEFGHMPESTLLEGVEYLFKGMDLYKVKG